MEQKPDGRRVRMTKLLLKDSLIELMKEKSIHSISIKEICECADINRSTFYRHYNSQYELYDDILEDITKDFNKIYHECLNEEFTITLLLTKILQYTEDNRTKFLVILSDKGNVSLGEAYNRFTGRFIERSTATELSTYITQFIAAGMTSLMWTWLNKDERRPAAEVASLINTIMMHGLKRAISFAPKQPDIIKRANEQADEE